MLTLNILFKLVEGRLRGPSGTVFHCLICWHLILGIPRYRSLVDYTFLSKLPSQVRYTEAQNNILGEGRSEVRHYIGN